MNCAHWLARFIKAQGIDTVFSVSGNQIMPVYDGCLDAEVRIIHARHEGACVFMADGYSQIARQPGIALVTAGSGFMNALGAAFAAKSARARVLLLSGDSPVKLDGQGAFQEMQQTRVFEAEFDFTRRPRTVPEFISAIEAAYQYLISDTCNGPAHVALPADILLAECDNHPVRLKTTDTLSATAQTIARSMQEAVQAATYPVVLLGPQLNRSRHPGLRESLSDLFDCPVLCMESPRGIADPAEPELADHLAQADLVILLAKPIDFTLKFGRGVADDCRWIVIDHDSRLISQAKANLSHTDFETHTISAEQVIQSLAITPTVKQSQVASHQKIEAHVELFEAITSVCQEQSRDVILISDGGEFGQWVQAALHASLRVINGVSGTIGGGLAYGMGAQIARPDALVIACMGDGTIGFHLGEYETAAREGLPVVTLIGNDHRWNAEYQIQVREFGLERAYACELSDAKYGEAVSALGGYGADIDEVSTLTARLRDAINHRTVACLNVTIDPIAYSRGAK